MPGEISRPMPLTPALSEMLAELNAVLAGAGARAGDDLPLGARKDDDFPDGYDPDADDAEEANDAE